MIRESFFSKKKRSGRPETSELINHIVTSSLFPIPDKELRHEVIYSEKGSQRHRDHCPESGQ